MSLQGEVFDMTTPARRRKRFLINSSMLTMYFLGMILMSYLTVAEVSFWDEAPAIENWEWAEVAFSAIVIIGCFTGIISIWGRAPKVLQQAIGIVAFATVIQGFVVLSVGALPLACRLLITPFLMLPAAEALAHRYALDIHMDQKQIAFDDKGMFCCKEKDK